MSAYVDESPSISIKDGVVAFEYADGAKQYIPLRVFRITLAKVERALAEYDARQAKVVPFKGRKRGGGGDHAAS